MPLWKGKPESQVAAIGRFVWKLTAAVVLTLVVFALIGLVVDAFFDLPVEEVEIIDR
jgi:hypothetical protein